MKKRVLSLMLSVMLSMASIMPGNVVLAADEEAGQDTIITTENTDSADVEANASISVVEASGICSMSLKGAGVPEGGSVVFRIWNESRTSELKAKAGEQLNGTVQPDGSIITSDGICEYQAVADGMGNWNIQADATLYENALYHITAYVIDTAGYTQLLAETGNICFGTKVVEDAAASVDEQTSDMPVETAAFWAEQPTADITVENQDNAAGTFRIRVANIQSKAGVQQIQIPVWCDADQNDIKWYAAQKDGETYYVDVKISNHKNHVGTYKAHIYLKDNDGVFDAIGTKNIDVRIIPGELTATMDAQNKVCQIQLTDAFTQGLGTDFTFAVWSEMNGQDDLVWYSAKQVSQGKWQADVALQNHKGWGNYQIHTYVNGKRTFVCKETFEVARPTADITVENQNNEAGTFRIKVENVQSPNGVQQIQIPVWCAADQNDLVWYTAQKSENTYYVDVKTSNHKYHIGTYKAHIYLRDNSGVSGAIGTQNVDVKIIPGNLTAVPNEKNRVCQVQLSDVFTQGVGTKFRFAVWSEENGQDDLIWYQAAYTDGRYILNVPLANHKSNGKYFVHVYLQDKNGNSLFVNKTEFNIVNRVENIPATISVKRINETTYRVTATDVDLKTTSVHFPTWSDKNGQDDLVWYAAKQVFPGTWQADIALKNHKSWGTYQIHTYVNGRKTFIGKTTFKVEKPTAEISVVNQNKDKGTFRIEVKNIQSQTGVQQIQIPVWCDADQNDIKWYTAQKSGDTYYVNVKTSYHKFHTGTYKAHIYLRDDIGVFDAIGTKNIDVRMTAGELTAIPDEAEKNCQIQLKDAYTQGVGGKMMFAVWSNEKGQDDLQWYTAAKNNQTYSYNVPIVNHKSLGNYFVHVYLQDEKGIKHFVSKTEFVIEKQATASIDVSTIENTTGQFKVTVSNIEAPSGVGSVQVAAWHSADKSDMHQYEAKRQDNGEYTAVVDVKNHKNHSGQYQVQAIVTMGNGIKNCAAEGNIELNVVNYIHVIQLSAYKARITIVNPTGEIGTVLFPTWSKENGQDDLIWYQGKCDADGNWYVDIDGVNHKHSGEYITHIYNRTGEGNQVLGVAPSYSVQNGTPQQRRVKQLTQARMAAVAGSGSSWDKLYRCFLWSTNFPYVTMDDTVAAGYTPSQWYAIVGFERQAGDCYTKAATFYYMAKELGYDAYYVQGYVPETGGRLADHGWCEIVIDGTVYVFDPSFQQGTGRNGFHFTYGSSGTWRYSLYSRVE